MPIKSKAQWKAFAVNHPDLLHKWQKEHPVKFSALPAHVKKRKNESVMLIDALLESAGEPLGFNEALAYLQSPDSIDFRERNHIASVGPASGEDRIWLTFSKNRYGRLPGTDPTGCTPQVSGMSIRYYPTAERYWPDGRIMSQGIIPMFSTDEKEWVEAFEGAYVTEKPRIDRLKKDYLATLVEKPTRPQPYDPFDL